MDDKKRNLIIGIVIYVSSAVVSFFIFSSISSGGQGAITTPVAPTKIGADKRAIFDEALPRTEECPLNGYKYSKQQREWWEKHRPLGVMVENHIEARPQSGLSYADVVYEAVAEGGITRFLAVYYCQDAGILGPVRSARTYFLDFISEYADFPLYAHVGGANTPGRADALGQIEEYGWESYNDLNQFSIGFPTFWRDYERLGHEVATEHTMYSTSQKLWDAAVKRKLTNKNKDGDSWDEKFVGYSFKDDAAQDKRLESQRISFAFWNGYDDYEVMWNYDKQTNTYLRTNGGKAHIDKNTDKQLITKNVVILFMRESRANDGYEGNLHMLYGTKGTGRAQIFIDGQDVTGTWSKKDRTSRTILRDSKGQEIKFNRGKIWFEILDIGSTVIVK